MARARNIKPAFFQNEELAELEPVDRLAFIALWTVCDYKGCLEYRPKRLKVQLLPYDEVDIEEIMINLEQSGFIKIYSVEDQNYIKILNFEKHQNPHPNEVKSGSNIPDFDEKAIEIKVSELVAINHDKDGTSHADSLLLIPDSLNPLTDTSTLTKKRMSTKKVVITDEIKNDFNIFWNSYRRKDKKADALKAWAKESPPLDLVLNHLSWKNKAKDWFDISYIPLATSYINGHRWEDEKPMEVNW